MANDERKLSWPRAFWILTIVVAMVVASSVIGQQPAKAKLGVSIAGTPILVNEGSATATSDTSVTVTLSAAPTIGNYVLCGASIANGTNATPSITGGLAPVIPSPPAVGTTAITTTAFGGIVTGSTPTSFTITENGNALSTTLVAACFEYQNVNAAFPIDGYAPYTQTGIITSSVSPPNFFPNAIGTLPVFIAGLDVGSVTAGAQAAWTEDVNATAAGLTLEVQHANAVTTSTTDAVLGAVGWSNAVSAHSAGLLVLLTPIGQTPNPLVQATPATRPTATAQPTVAPTATATATAAPSPHVTPHASPSESVRASDVANALVVPITHVTPHASPSDPVTIVDSPGASVGSGMAIKQWTWDGSSDTGARNDAGSVSGSVMAHYFTGVFCGGHGRSGNTITSSNECIKFKTAGGLYYGDYQDGTYGQGCSPTTGAPSNVACSTGGADDAWKSGHPASFYLLNSGGSLVARGAALIMNLTNSSVVTTWTNWLSGAAGNDSPSAVGFNTTFSDDVIGNTGDLYSGFNGTSPSITSNAQLVSLQQTMMSAYPPSVQPMANDLNNAGGNTGNVALTSNLRGGFYENCVQAPGQGNATNFFSGTGNSADAVVIDPVQSGANANKTWATQMNLLLWLQQHSKLAMCYPGSSTSSPTQTVPRIYLAASMWLIDDGVHTIVWPGYTKDGQQSHYPSGWSPATDAPAMPEFQIVPGSPVQSASTVTGGQQPIGGILNLTSGSHVYRREFTGCRINGVSGTFNCAAVLNADATSHSISGLLTNSYSHSYVISATNSLINPAGAGVGAFTGSVPSSLAGGSAVLLRQ